MIYILYTTTKYTVNQAWGWLWDLREAHKHNMANLTAEQKMLGQIIINKLRNEYISTSWLMACLVCGVTQCEGKESVFR